MTILVRVSEGPRLISRRVNDPWRYGEPDIADVMADPIVHLLMRRDGLVPDAVWPVVRDAQARLGGRLCRLNAQAA